MLFKILQKIFVADERFVYALLEGGQILLILMERSADCIIHEI
jgi:hypothetical protein